MEGERTRRTKACECESLPCSSPWTPSLNSSSDLVGRTVVSWTLRGVAREARRRQREGLWEQEEEGGGGDVDVHGRLVDLLVNGVDGVRGLVLEDRARNRSQ